MQAPLRSRLRRLVPPLRTLAASALVVLLAPRAQAALGEAAASVDRDAAALSAARAGDGARPGYTVTTLVAEGLTVREYLTPAGQVFAVAWDGVGRPDLDALLGAQAREYRAALAAAPRAGDRRGRRVETAHLVVEVWGHMRHDQGRAWLPGLLPAGVSVDAIR